MKQVLIWVKYEVFTQNVKQKGKSIEAISLELEITLEMGIEVNMIKPTAIYP